MQKSVITGILGLIAGLVIGFLASNSLNRGAMSSAVAKPPASDVTSPPLPPSSQAPQGGMLPDVAETLEKAKNEPNNFAAQMNAGDMYAKIGRYDKAIEFLERGVALNPDNFEANVALANAYFDTKQFESAENYYTKALEINPRDINARTDLGTTFVERENPNFDRGIKEFETSLSINPNHEPTLYNLGVAYSRMGDKENSAKVLSRIEESNPGSPLAGRLRENLNK